MVDPLFMKTKEPCEACTKDAGLENDEINEILLVGGMTRMPIVTEVGRSVFDKDPSNSVNPDEVVAMKAAIQNGVLKGDVRSFTPLSIGLETMGSVFTRLLQEHHAPYQSQCSPQQPTRWSLRHECREDNRRPKVSVALRRFSGGAMAGDAFMSGVCRVGPPTERPLLPWEALELAAFFTPVGSMWLPDPLLVRAGRRPPLPFGSPVPVETAGAVAEAGQPFGAHKRTTRKIFPAAGETDQGVEEETKLTQWREELYFVLSGGGAALRATGVRCISAVCEDQVGGNLAPPQESALSDGVAPSS